MVNLYGGTTLRYVQTTIFPTLWLVGWKNRIKVTANHTYVTSSLTNFPALVYISEASGSNVKDIRAVFNEVGSNNKKIAITTSDGTSQCYVEIERWDSTNKKAWLWVKIPSLSSLVDTDLYLYFDSSQPNNTTYVGDVNSTVGAQVWDSNFKAVWHLSESSGTLYDSTGNNNDITAYNNPTYGYTGKIGKCIDFASVSVQYLKIASAVVSSYPATLESWCNLDSWGWVGPMISRSSGGYAAWGLYADTHSNYYCCAGPGTDSYATSTNTFSLGQWGYLAGVGVSATQRNAYLNATGKGTNSVSRNPSSMNITHAMILDSNWGASSSPCDGRVDEIRISNIDRSEDYLKATYETECDNLFIYGDIEHLTSLFAATRLLGGVITNKFESVRRLAYPITHIAKTLRLFEFESLYNTFRELKFTLNPFVCTVVYKGQWSSTYSYNEGDIVWYTSGATKTYRAKRSNSNKVPSTELTYWQYLYDGQHKFVIPDHTSSVDVIIVAGGGGGGGCGYSHSYGFSTGAGGGAGGLVFVENYNISSYKTAGYADVAVGNGGASETNGGNSSFGNLTAVGGGKGGRGAGNSSANGGNGGSGGGGGVWYNSAGPPYQYWGSGGITNQTTTNDGYPNTGFGYNGKASYSPGFNAGGGGGAGAAATDYNGGAGKMIWGTTYSTGGTGGLGVYDNGTPFTGEGGGGRHSEYDGQYKDGSLGGSGIVIVKYVQYHYSNTERKLTNYVSLVYETLRKPTIFTQYIGKTLRLFKVVFLGETYRENKVYNTYKGKAERKLGGPIVHYYNAVRKLAAPIFYSFNSKRNVVWIAQYIAETYRTVRYMFVYRAKTYRNVLLRVTPKWKTVRRPSIMITYAANTFRYVGKLVTDLINKIKVPLP